MVLSFPILLSPAGTLSPVPLFLRFLRSPLLAGRRLNSPPFRHKGDCFLFPQGISSRRSRSSARRSSRDTWTWDTPSTRAAFIWVIPR